MRAEILRGAVAILIAGTGVGLAAGSANAEAEAVAELEAQDDADLGIPDPTPTASGAEWRREQREPPYQRRQKWWTHARAVLFSDIQLSAEQLRGVNEILEAQLADLKRSGELKAELKAAKQRADVERGAAIRAESRALRARIKDPHECIEAMRALLTEEQRPSFDMNRARLIAEGDPPQKKRRRRRPGADEGLKVE